MITLFLTTRSKRPRDLGRVALRMTSGRPGYPGFKEKIYHLSLMEVRMMERSLRFWKRKGRI